MEVLLKNVPKDLSNENLRRELVPFMNALGILDWSCEKPRRRAQAWILFLVEADGNKFLKKHEKHRVAMAPPKDSMNLNAVFKSQPKDVPRLYILKTAIYVEKSARPPDAFMLKHLAFKKEERKPDLDRDPKAPTINAPIHGLSCGKNVFLKPSYTLTYVEQTRLRVSSIAKFGRRYMTLTFSDDFRMDVSCNTIQDLIAEPSGPFLTLVLTEPPRFYTKAQISELFPNVQGWLRASSLSGLWPGHSIYVAHCLVYQLSIAEPYFNETINALMSRHLLSVTRQHLPTYKTPRPGVEDYSTSMQAFRGKIQALGTAGRANVLPFIILFQVEALIWNNYLHPASGVAMLELMERIARDYKTRSQQLPFTTDTMKQLFHKIPYPCPGTAPQELEVEWLLRNVIETEQELRAQDPSRTTHYGANLSNRQTWVLKAMVTPTRILLHGPDAESKNRVLRMFPDHSDYFMRVTFCDEDGQDLAFNPNVRNTAVFERYRKVLREGIQIAGRRFSFLGFSHSSLRSHSAWYSAPFVDHSMKRQDYDSIIGALGNFKGIRVPAKCAARIGQAFSETPYAVPIFECEIGIRWIDDVKSKDGSRVFSDGVGTISWDALEEVWDCLPMTSATPTCLQVRLAGVKGMLSLDTRLTGKVICVRKESMMKFESNDYETMGICDTASKPLRLVLNRQTIKILEDMGTREDWFVTQQNKALRVLRGVTATALNTSTFLQNQLVCTSVGFPKFIKQLSKMGIDYRRDSFMKSVVEHVVLRELRLLKHKARIPVDQGVTLFGVMDETGFLQEDEVYITFDEKYDKRHSRVPKSLKDGYVLVTRSPALHPGDIQYVRMVTPPHGHPLRFLENCIVFSQKGTRDLPSQLSGGDLDGDLYSVIWDPQARPLRRYTPADYPRVVPMPLNREVTRDDITDFFIKFMETDVLGLIANRHQILADIKDEGTVDSDCIELAEMHSTAVDFSKTGIPVVIQDIPKAPPTRPDFLAPAPPLVLYDLGQVDHIGEHEEEDEDEEDGMGRAKHRFYKSIKILGRLYRGVDEKRIWNEDVKRPVNMSGPTVWEQLLGRVQANVCTETGYGPSDIDYRRKVETALKIRDLYETTIVDNMWHFSDNPRVPITEVEVFCGSIMNKVGSLTRRQRDSSIRLSEEMDAVMTWIVKLIRDRGAGGEESSSAAGASTTAADEERERINAVELCWACVVVGCKDARAGMEMGGGVQQGRMESFRVVAACCLVKELTELLRLKRASSDGGGYLGVSGGPRQQTTLPMR